MTCSALQTQELTEYWLGDVDAAHEQRVDEHLLACDACSNRLSALVGMGAAIRRAFLGGWLNIILPESFIRRLKEAGFRVREYDLAAGGSVDCTVTQDDDFVVSYLRARLSGVQRLDVLIDDQTSGKFRARDVAFDPDAESLVSVTSTAYLRMLKRSRQRVQLVAVDGVHERVVADYTFNHFPS